MDKGAGGHKSQRIYLGTRSGVWIAQNLLQSPHKLISLSWTNEIQLLGADRACQYCCCGLPPPPPCLPQATHLFQPILPRNSCPQVLWNRTEDAPGSVTVQLSPAPFRAFEPPGYPAVDEFPSAVIPGLSALLRMAATGPPTSFQSTFPRSLSDLNDINWLLAVVFVIACAMVALVLFSNLWPYIYAGLSLDIFIDDCMLGRWCAGPWQFLGHGRAVCRNPDFFVSQRLVLTDVG